MGLNMEEKLIISKQFRGEDISVPLFPVLHLETVSRLVVPYNSCFSFSLFGDFSTKRGNCTAWPFVVVTTVES